MLVSVLLLTCRERYMSTQQPASRHLVHVEDLLQYRSSVFLRQHSPCRSRIPAVTSKRIHLIVDHHPTLLRHHRWSLTNFHVYL